MNREVWKELSSEEQQIKAAECDGWIEVSICMENNPDGNCGLASDGFYGTPPDYLNDLNAMHKAVESLRGQDNSLWFDFQVKLMEDCGSTMNCIQATAAQRAEAFVLIMDKKD